MGNAAGAQSAIRHTWWDYAACDGQNVTLFYGPTGELPTERAEREAQAKRICRRCPARPWCLAFAVARGEVHGIWGGLTPGERSAIRHRHRAESTPDPGNAIPGQRLSPDLEAPETEEDP